MTGTVLHAAEVQATPTALRVVRRDSLFAMSLRGAAASHQLFDVSPDGTPFVGIDAMGSDLRLKVVLNWLTEVRPKLR